MSRISERARLDGRAVVMIASPLEEGHVQRIVAAVESERLELLVTTASGVHAKPLVRHYLDGYYDKMAPLRDLGRGY